jgi:hypothetical protein
MMMERKKREKEGEKSGDSSLHGLERRQFLKMGVVATGSLLIPRELFAYMVSQVEKGLQTKPQKLQQQKPTLQKAEPKIQKLTPAQKNKLQRDLSNKLEREWDRIEDRYVVEPIRPPRTERPMGPNDVGMGVPPATDPAAGNIGRIEDPGPGTTGYCDSNVTRCAGDESDDECEGTYTCLGRQSGPPDCPNVSSTPQPTYSGGDSLSRMINNFVRTNFQDLANLYGTENRAELFNHVVQMLVK